MRMFGLTLCEDTIAACQASFLAIRQLQQPGVATEQFMNILFQFKVRIRRVDHTRTRTQRARSDQFTGQ
jgi:hypothetical protein